MAEVAPSEILIIDRASEASVYANSEPVVQSLIERFGGVHNIHLARLWTAKRCLLVEGKDRRVPEAPSRPPVPRRRSSTGRHTQHEHWGLGRVELRSRLSPVHR